MKRLLVGVVALATSATIAAVSAGKPDADWKGVTTGLRLQSFPAEFQETPPQSSAYMVDNTGNLRGVAPSKGKYNGAVWSESGSFEDYMKKLAEKKADVGNTLAKSDDNNTFWLSSLGPRGKAPLAGDNYVFYRNVLDYGADNTGTNNTEEAINAAIIDGNRCGEDCGSTSVRGALIYFPPGTYKICTPIIQYYFTQFVGDPNDRPVIKGCDTFTGIALMDVNPYIPGSGINWYIPQNQFFRQIRNFVFDLTSMPAATDENGQPLVPTGIHWQVSQACTLQNLLFRMPTADDLGGKSPTHVGIFTENGSGGFVSDLVFEGGAIGWRVGSQQYTATSLQFRNCSTAVDMVWDWGFNWHKIEIDGGSIGFNISGIGGLNDQGIGSVSIIDSVVKNVPIGLLAAPRAANVILDNTVFTNVGTIMVLTGTNDPIIEGTTGTKEFALWEYGKHYIHNRGESTMGSSIDDRPRPAALLDGTGNLFTRLRPQYENLTTSSFLVATDEGCFNNGTGDNTDAINAFLKKALDAKQIAYFPAGIYSVQGTVTFPTGSQIQGSGWSQIQATGTYFSDMTNPKVVVRVGEPGDVGTMEIADMLFTTKGATAGAIMMEWNLHESSQGAAALWDSHIRIGGANGTDLDNTACPKFSQNEACIGASLLLHVTKDATGYFENFWAWVADHDIDMSLPREMNSTKSQISVFGARGILIESQGPVWLYGSGSEHLMFYQYQLVGAKNVYLGHLQTESPYFQPQPVAPSPMDKALGVLPEDPNWGDCTTDTCKMAWGLRILNSEAVMVHGAGLYSFFNNFSQICTSSESCQERIMEVRGSKDISIYNIFTKAVVEIATGSSNESSIEFADNNQHSYTSEISVWFPEDGGPEDVANIVYVGPEVYENHTVQCPSPPCILVMPPTTLATPTTIYIDPYTTELEVGQSQNGTFTVTTTTVTITMASIVTSVIPVANYNYTGEESEGAPLWITPSIDLPLTPIVLTKPDGVVTTRTLTLLPWPQITFASDDANSTTGTAVGSGAGNQTDNATTSTSDRTVVLPTPTEVLNLPPMTAPCPFEDLVWIPEKQVYLRLPFSCPAGVESTTIPWDCLPTTTTWLSYPTNVSFDLGCIHWTGVGEALPTYSEFPEDVYIQMLDHKPDDNSTTYCDGFYIFWICIPLPTLHLDFSWIQLHFPIPGPFVFIGPPPIRFPDIPGLTINIPKLPGPWPPITIDPTGRPIEPQESPTNCETQEAEVCATSTFISTTVIGSSTSTITSSATTECDTIRACVVTDVDQDTTSSTGEACPLPTEAAAELLRQITGNTTAAPESQDTNQVNKQKRNKAALRDPPIDGFDHVMIWPKNPGNSEEVAKITDWLKSHGPGGPEWEDRPNYGDYTEIKAEGFGDDGSDWSMLLFVEEMRNCHQDELRAKMAAEITDIYGIYKETQRLIGYPSWAEDSGEEFMDSGSPMSEGDFFANMEANVNKSSTDYDQMQRREVKTIGPEIYWELSQMAVAPAVKWSDTSEWEKMYYTADDSFGKGQTVFIVEELLWDNHPELVNTWQGYERPAIRKLPEFEWSKSDRFYASEKAKEAGYLHGTGITSKVVGWQLGLAKKAQVILVPGHYYLATDLWNTIWEQYLEKFIRIYHEVKRLYAEDPSQRGKVIVSMSVAFMDHQSAAVMKPIYIKRWRELLTKLMNELDVVVVQTTHNNHQQVGDALNGIPYHFCDPLADDDTRLDNLICVGGVDAMGRIGGHSAYRDWLIMAPAYAVHSGYSETGIVYGAVGNSFATPTIAGLVAYWRGLPDIKNGWGEELKKPANVKKLLQFMHRSIDPKNLAKGLDRSKVPIYPEYNGRGDDPPFVPFIWSGEYDAQNCLTNPDIHPSCPWGRLQDLTPFGTGCDQYTSGTCVMSVSYNPPTNTPGPGAFSDPITFQTGPANVTCTPGSPGCGSLCTGYYCGPAPSANASTDFPPDHYDPEDPNHWTTITQNIIQTVQIVTATVRRNNTSSPSVKTVTVTQDPAQTTVVYVTKSQSPVTGTITSGATPTVSAGSPSSTGNSLLFTGTECDGYTSTKMCPEASLCIDGDWCLPTQPPCPQWHEPGAPLCETNKPSCTSSYLANFCTVAPALKQVREVAMSSSMPTPTPPPVNANQQDTRLSRPKGRIVAREEGSIDGGGSDFVCPEPSDGCFVKHACDKADCVLPSTQVACINAQLVFQMRSTVKEVFVTIMEDDKLACAFSLFCHTTEGADCLEKEIPEDGIQCLTGRITSWTNGFSDMEFVSNTGGSDYTYHLFFAQNEGRLGSCQARRDKTGEYAMCYRTEWLALDGACGASLVNALMARPRNRLADMPFGFMEAPLNQTLF